MPDFGSLAWIEHTGGKLAWRDRLRMAAEAALAHAAARWRVPAHAKFRHIEVDRIIPPDTEATRAAAAICAEASARFLVNHCLRAYFWARLLDDGRASIDDEALFVATMLHDLGLTEAYRLTPGPIECFTAAGARVATDLARRHQWPERRAAIAANAIALHLNITVAARHGREARLLRAGSGADVAGLGLDVLHADQIAAVVALHPRLHFKRDIMPPLAREAERHPRCRIAFLQRKLGFGRLIRATQVFTE